MSSRHIDINIHELGCDFFTGAIHKWLCGPKGSSFLFVKKSHQDWIKPIIYSWGKDGDDPGPTEFLQDFQWQGTRDMSSFLTIPKTIEFFINTLTKPKLLPQNYLGSTFKFQINSRYRFCHIRR